MRWSPLISFAAATIFAAGALAACSDNGNTTSASTSTAKPATPSSSAAATTTSEARVALSDLKPTGNDVPDVKQAAIDGVTVGKAVYIGPCSNNDENSYNYRIPTRNATFTATVAMADRSASTEQVRVEFFLNDVRVAVVDPRLGKPGKVTLDVFDSTAMSIRTYPYDAESCGESKGVVLANAEFSTTKNPAATKRTEDASKYVVEVDSVSSRCDSFDLKSGHKPMALNGQVQYHALSAGRKDNLGDDAGPCVFEYDLARSTKKLVAVAGVFDSSTPTFSCRIEISADGKPVFSKDLPLGTTEPVDVSVEGALRLKVEFTFLAKGYGECALGDFRLFQPSK